MALYATYIKPKLVSTVKYLEAQKGENSLISLVESKEWGYKREDI